MKCNLNFDFAAHSIKVSTLPKKRPFLNRVKHEN